MTSEGSRLLAIDPSKRGFAFAVFEGRDHLLDWNISYLNILLPAEVRDHFDSIIRRNQPIALVLEDVERDEKTNAAKLLVMIKAEAKRHGLPLIVVTRKAIRKLFNGARNKHKIAEALAQLYPELAPRLPPPRRAWMNQDERMDIFDAVSFGFTALSK